MKGCRLENISLKKPVCAASFGHFASKNCNTFPKGIEKYIVIGYATEKLWPSQSGKRFKKSPSVDSKHDTCLSWSSIFFQVFLSMIDQ
jgi:hypothetical protein